MRKRRDRVRLVAEKDTRALSTNEITFWCPSFQTMPVQHKDTRALNKNKSLVMGQLSNWVSSKVTTYMRSKKIAELTIFTSFFPIRKTLKGLE